MLKVGDISEVSYFVGGADSAKNLRLGEGDDFPDVLATARMVGLMELASARLMKPLLQDGELSVGVNVEITHSAATPICQNVQAKATYLGREGKLHKFRVEMFDDGGKVGEGIHTRAVVCTERLISSAMKRIAEEK
jgi:fluoroacetyl-CoA thioesterase